MHSRERIGDVEVAFDDQGQGPAVVMLPPFPFDGRAWEGASRALVAAGHRVVAIDYPGFGDSPPPPRPLSIAGLAQVVEGLLDGLDVPRAALVGLSMGGYVALAFCRLAPRRVWALVLADTRAAADTPTVRQGRADAQATIRDQGVDAYLAQSLPRLLAPTAAARLLAEVTALAEKREDALHAGIAALRDRPDRTAELAALACPTLVVVGALDQVTPAREMRDMAASIPDARFVELSGAGHLSNLEAPEPFQRAVVDFLRDVRDHDLSVARVS